MSKRTKLWLDIHSYASMFFLPAAILYAVTGGITIIEPAEKHGKPGTEMAQKLQSSGEPVRNEAEHKNIRTGERPGPSIQGEPKGKMRPDIKKQGLFFKLMLLHKAKGGAAFDVLGVSFAIAIIAMYLSGIWMCWSNKKRRKRMLITCAIGLVVTTALVIVSLP